MKRLFEIIDEINRAGIDNSVWGCVENVRTKEHFGTDLDIELQGRWIFIFRNKVDEPLLSDYVGITLALKDNLGGSLGIVIDLYVFDACSNYDSVD